MLKPRLITATILAAFFASMLVFLSPFVFAQIMIFVILVAGWEWANLADFKTRLSKYGFLLALGIGMIATGYHVGFHSQLDITASYNICALVVVFWAIIFLWLQGFPTSAILWSPKPVMTVSTTTSNKVSIKAQTLWSTAAISACKVMRMVTLLAVVCSTM